MGKRVQAVSVVNNTSVILGLGTPRTTAVTHGATPNVTGSNWPSVTLPAPAAGSYRLQYVDVAFNMIIATTTLPIFGMHVIEGTSSYPPPTTSTTGVYLGQYTLFPGTVTPNPTYPQYTDIRVAGTYISSLTDTIENSIGNILTARLYPAVTAAPMYVNSTRLYYLLYVHAASSPAVSWGGGVADPTVMVAKFTLVEDT